MMKSQITNLLALISSWFLLLIFLALMPERVVLFFLRKPFFFSVAHIVAYWVLAFFLCLYLRFKRTFFVFRMNWWNIFFLTLVCCMACGGITEAVQVLTPDRAPDWYDFYCDLGGAMSGILFFMLFSKSPFMIKFLTARSHPIPKIRIIPRQLP